MKKSKLTFGLVAGFVGTLALASCSGITASKDSVMEFKDYNGNTVSVKSDEIYGDYAKTSAGIGKYYDAVLETLIRYNFENPQFKGNLSTSTNKLARSYAEVLNLAKNQVASEKKTCEDNAKTNHTKFSEDWEAILEEKGVETDDELVKLYVYSYEKEDMVTWYYKENETTLLQQYLGLDKDYKEVAVKDSTGNILVNSMFPYHVRHILVKTSGSATNYSRDVITEDEAKNLSNLMTLLTQVNSTNKRVNTFGEVAGMSINEDSSKDSYGDLGLVATDTSFVNEFKLGMYAYDAILSGKNTENEATNKFIYNGLGLNSQLKNMVTTTTEKTVKKELEAQTSLGYVPVEVFAELGKYKDKVKDDNGHEVCEGAEVLYPRNILWNQYLNNHSVFVITNEKIAGGEYDANIADCFGATVGGKNVLTDEENRVVVCVRSEYGIHFMSILKSVFKDTNDAVKSDKYKSNLEEYYNTTVPEIVGENDKVTYITAVNRTDKIVNYRTRSDAIKTAVKGFDKTYDYRLYEALLDKNITKVEVTFKDASLKANIDEYIAVKKASNKQSADETLTNAWRTYIELLAQQKEARQTYEYNGTNYTGTLYKTVCYQKFGSGDSDAAFQKGGDCYYGK